MSDNDGAGVMATEAIQKSALDHSKSDNVEKYIQKIGVTYLWL